MNLDTIKSSKVMQEALDITGEIIKLSPRKGSAFQRLNDEIAPQDAIVSCAPPDGQLRRKL